MKTIITIAVLCIFLFGGFATNDKNNSVLKNYIPREGDILFQSLSGGELVKAINGVSRSNYSHCGVLILDTNNKWMVIEAYNQVVKTSLETWIKRGINNGFAAYRLKNTYNSSIALFVDSAKAMLGLPYDFHFNTDDEHIYCSELVYKAFKRANGKLLGKMETLCDMNWKPFEKFIRKIEKGNLPLDRKIISPANLSMAEQLECVFKDNI